jgi:hypothetical protein
MIKRSTPGRVRVKYDSREEETLQAKCILKLKSPKNMDSD